MISLAPFTAAQRTLVLLRCLKVVTHEAGHMFGLEHCIEHSCLMNGSNHADEMDHTPVHLCSFCLRTVHHATRLDVEERYEGLRAFYRREGLEAEARWVDAAGTPPALSGPRVAGAPGRPGG